ncbi:MAG: Zn-ribbon domain-containing OB-fold protein [Dehalococcoidia bacterium]|nr:Zn-ribbon domain-containing OB-fold protein [Dehalococcoidia bacterium]
MTEAQAPAPHQVPIKEDLFIDILRPLAEVRLRGTRCGSCGETFFGKKLYCENCQSEDTAEIVLSNRGKIYSYTVNRYRPPGDYIGPDPYVPFAVGLVELPEGVRVLSPLKDCPVDTVKIGMEVELVVEKLFTNSEGNDVIAFKFKPVG